MSQRKRAPARARTITVKEHTRAITPRRKGVVDAQAAGSLIPSLPNWLLRSPYLMEAGVPVTPENALQVSALYGCGRLIVDAIAAAPLRVYNDMGSGRRELLHGDPVARLLNYGARIDWHPDAPTAQAIEEGLFWPALTGDGNGYAEIQRNGAGDPVALWPIEPGRVTPKRKAVIGSDGKERSVYYYEVQQATGGTVDVDPMSIFHLRGPSLLGWVGDSTLYRAAKAVGIAQAEQVFGAAYFANGTVVSGLLTSDKIVTQAQADEAKAQWKALHGGPGKSHEVAVTGQGLKYQPINHNAKESQLVESRRFQVAEIARFYGVPLSLLAENEAWTNLSELYQGFVRNAVLPWASRFDAEATRKLFPQRAPWREVEHDLTQLRMGSFKDQVASLDQAVEGGLISRNEGRVILGQNTMGKDGDVMVVRSTVKRLEDVLNPPAPPPALPAKSMPEEPEHGEDDDAPPPAPMRRKPADVARVAVALDRFERSLSGRRKAIQKDAPEKAEANVAEYRGKLEPALVAEIAAAMGDNGDGLDMRVRTVADAVLSGEPAHLAAERLCT